jgi:zinc protease
MTRGSEKYNYDFIKKAMYEKSSAITYATVGYDYSTFELNTLDKYWKDLFPVFSDIFMKPGMLPDMFKQVQNDLKVAAQKASTDQYELTVSELHKAMFAGHPYSIEAKGTMQTLAALTLDDVKNYYASTFGAERMFIVAVGNFDEVALLKDLNATFGAMAKKNVKLEEVPKWTAKADLLLVPFKTAKGVAHVRGDYPIAPVTDRDFIVQQFANSILNELLFSIVRTDNGGCYSVAANAHGFKNSYGSLVVYRTNKPSGAKLWVDQAIALLASGKTLNIKGKGDKYAPITDTIEAYKAKYINAFFGNQVTNAEQSNQLAYSFIYFNDAYEYLRLADKIASITPEDVIRVVNKNLVNGTITWIVVSDQATLNSLNKDNYARFTAN